LSLQTYYENFPEMPDTNIYSEYSVIFSSGFYRATRIMHSADYAVQDVCLSVRLSVCHTLLFCLNGYTYPQNYFTIGYPTILVFPYQTNGMAILRRGLP